ncbi:hypothetical protein [Paenisporosarcina cavernae]|uniref:Uncharacterized protein n=1 Tax=Paenisporosarcina cavernae TaxID=2320858 RepID=A0A385YUP0_9BACL|nr:hypothetical protein [Paenisporosarcina cavernae]AYC29637.1 hypothetical protein D3873_06950 [Paenisporosarcina cavernae]
MAGWGFLEDIFSFIVLSVIGFTLLATISVFSETRTGKKTSGLVGNTLYLITIPYFKFKSLFSFDGKRRIETIVSIFGIIFLYVLMFYLFTL